jgi:hypothetical protein
MELEKVHLVFMMRWGQQGLLREHRPRQGGDRRGPGVMFFLTVSRKTPAATPVDRGPPSC